jgi:hypothetical protein
MSLTKATYSMIQGAPANVLDYGADATGVADSTAAFNLALATGRAVYAPKGTYKINIVISSDNKTICGDGIGKTIFSPFTAASPVITLNGDIAGTIIRNFLFENFTINGNAKQGHGFLITNTADTRGVDEIVWRNLRINFCNCGIFCGGRSIWNELDNVYCDYNIDGIHIETDQAVNTWAFTNCGVRVNNRDGFYAEKTDVSVTGMIGFTFNNFNAEYNGQDTSLTTVRGMYISGAQGWVFNNLTLEGNGADLPSVESYGVHFTGILNSGIVINGCWAVNSKYMIVFQGTRAGGSVDNIYFMSPYAGGRGLYIASQWANDLAKIQLGQSINGLIEVVFDVNGLWPITQGVDYYGGAQTTLSLQNRKNVTINTVAATSNIATLTGLISGDVVFLYNYANGGTNKITLAAGLMASGVAYDINADTGKQFMVLGFPFNGKLTPI